MTLWMSITVLILDALVIFLRVYRPRRRPVSAWVTVAPGVRVRATS